MRAVFAIIRLLRYAREERISDDPLEVPALLAKQTPEFEADFKAVLKQIQDSMKRTRAYRQRLTPSSKPACHRLIR